MSSPNKAVLLLAHGTPESVEEIPDYLLKVTSGRPLPPHVITEIQHRYSLIGKSPLTAITLEQGRMVHAELLAAGIDVPVYVAMRNWHPYIADVVAQMKADGIEQMTVICLAPQNSRTSVGLYRRAVETAATDMAIDFVAGWAEHPLLIEAFTARLRAVLEPDVPVLFTAHSVPCRTIQTPADGSSAADPYAEEAKRTAELVAKAAGIEAWYFAFQSQGASGGPWIGPTVEATLDALAEAGVRRLILQPIGFLCDHVEILYDVDMAFRSYAAERGIDLVRPESLNASQQLAAAVADLAKAGLARL